MQKFAYIALLLAASFLAGCLNSFENPYFTVKSSGLNWLHIRQYDSTGRRPTVHVRIDGNGTVVVREGKSPLMSDPFAHNTKGENWDDLRETRLSISEEETMMIFQSLINNGLFVKRHKSLFSEDIATNETYFVYASANIQNKTTSSPDPITEPNLLEDLKMTISWFYHPRPAKKTPISTEP